MLLNVSSAIKCLDLNTTRTKIAVVEESNSSLRIFNIKNDDCELIHEVKKILVFKK